MPELRGTIPVLIHLINGLHSHFPSVPQIPLVFHIHRAFTEKPLHVLGWGQSLRIMIFFSAIGVAYLLTLEISCSSRHDQRRHVHPLPHCHAPSFSLVAASSHRISSGKHTARRSALVMYTTWKVNLNVPLAACLPVFYRTWDSQLQALADKLPVAHSGLLTFVE